MIEVMLSARHFWSITLHFGWRKPTSWIQLHTEWWRVTRGFPSPNINANSDQTYPLQNVTIQLEISKDFN